VYSCVVEVAQEWNAALERRRNDARTVRRKRNGILIGPGEAPEANREVLLDEADVLDLTGKKEERLKERPGTQILDRGDIVARAKTGDWGRFEFKGVAGGRYCAGVWPDGGEPRLINLRGQEDGRTVVLDLAEGEEVAVGKVLVRKQ
jgi:hypothetical protein